jgi:hypothetical protein
MRLMFSDFSTLHRWAPVGFQHILRDTRQQRLDRLLIVDSAPLRKTRDLDPRRFGPEIHAHPGHHHIFYPRDRFLGAGQLHLQRRFFPCDLPVLRGQLRPGLGFCFIGNIHIPRRVERGLLPGLDQPPEGERLLDERRDKRLVPWDYEIEATTFAIEAYRSPRCVRHVDLLLDLGEIALERRRSLAMLKEVLKALP